MAAIQTTEDFDDWFEDLRDRAAKARIAARLTRLELGNKGDHRNLKGGVFELRIDYGPGYRIYATERAGVICILLCGGDKDSQQADIEKAMDLAAQL